MPSQTSFPFLVMIFNTTLLGQPGSLCGSFLLPYCPAHGVTGKVSCQAGAALGSLSSTILGENLFSREATFCTTASGTFECCRLRKGSRTAVLTCGSQPPQGSQVTHLAYQMLTLQFITSVKSQL